MNKIDIKWHIFTQINNNTRKFQTLSKKKGMVEPYKYSNKIMVKMEYVKCVVLSRRLKTS